MHTEINDKLNAHGTVKSKHRLADISHHFLSDSDERLPIWQNSHIIPVLLGSKSDDYIVYQLERAFQKHDHSSMVLNIEAGLSTQQPLNNLVPKKFTSRPTTRNRDKQPALPEYCLVPVTSPSTILALKCERLVITVHASLTGVRLAYNQLSFLASLNTNINVCVVMIGANTAAEARRFFGFLGNSARSFLELKIECGGYVLRSHERDSGLADGMSDVTRFIYQNFLTPKKTSRAKALNKPFGPAAYLS